MGRRGANVGGLFVFGAGGVGFAGEADGNPEEVVIHFDVDVLGWAWVEVELGAAVAEAGEELAEIDSGEGAAGFGGGLAGVGFGHGMASGRSWTRVCRRRRAYAVAAVRTVSDSGLEVSGSAGDEIVRGRTGRLPCGTCCWKLLRMWRVAGWTACGPWSS